MKPVMAARWEREIEQERYELRLHLVKCIRELEALQRREGTGEPWSPARVELERLMIDDRKALAVLQGLSRPASRNLIER